MWFRRKVKSGTQIGRTMGYPTLNFNVGSLDEKFTPGVYSCQLRVAGRDYRGALYLGPRFGSKKPVLEVFVLEFKREIYGAFVSFMVGKKIRGPITFSSPDELKVQIKKDLEVLYNA